MLEGHPDPAILLDRDYRVLAANPAYCQVYGEGRPLVGRRCYEVSHHYNVPCDQAGESCPLAESLATGQPQRVLHLHHTPRGEEHVEVETRPVRNAAGEIVYFMEIMRQTRVASARPSERSLVGRSPSFNRMIELMHRVAPSDASVLLLGETGTGKELVAQAIHEASQRAGAAFVPVECAGLTDTLFESELFGHEKGAFTGATTRKIGLVESARGGTLFLDELGDIPLSMQVKLLRLLETGTYRRVGGIEPQQADFRLICATHRDIPSMVEAGTFRGDLYYRIGVFPIHLPALRERAGDLPVLVEALLQRIEWGRDKGIGPAALRCLSQYAFPGNIRELRNLLERACILCDGDTLLPAHFPDICEGRSAGPEELGMPLDEVIPLDELERRYLRRVAVRYGGDRRELAQRLGVSERTLYRKLEALHLTGRSRAAAVDTKEKGE
jgi:DNA-binding NtrC family response regulator